MLQIMDMIFSEVEGGLNLCELPLKRPWPPQTCIFAKCKRGIFFEEINN